LIEYAELADWVKPDADDAATLVLLEKRAVDYVERETLRHFGATETFTDIYAGTGTNTLWLRNAPSALTTVKYRQGVGDSWVSILTGDDDGWELDGYRVRRNRGYVWDRAEEFQIIYDFGYAANAEPGDIRQAVLDLTKWAFDNRAMSAGLISEQIGPERYTRATFGRGLDDMPWVRETLARWTWRRAA
jgi:hypothetical protein